MAFDIQQGRGRNWALTFLYTGLGVAFGLALGLYLGWIAWPTQYTDATPRILQESYRRDYVLMIATAYTADQDLATAERQLSRLGLDGQELLLSVTIDAILGEGNETEIRRLVRLAADLGLESPIMTPYLGRSENAP